MDRVIIRTPGDVLALLEQYKKKKVEHFGIITLDSGKRVIGIKTLSKGGVSFCTVDLKVIFWELCKKQASAFIVFHNHPCGDSTPSSYDIDVTRKLKEAADIMTMPLLDHVIIAENNYFSFLEHDLILNDIAEVKKVAEK